MQMGLGHERDIVTNHPDKSFAQMRGGADIEEIALWLARIAASWRP